MARLLFQNCREQTLREEALPRRYRRVSQVVGRYADRSRPHMSFLYRARTPIAMSDGTVVLKAERRHRLVGKDDTVVIMYLPDGGSNASTGKQIGMTVAAIALAIAIPYAAGAVAGAFSAASLGGSYTAIKAALTIGMTVGSALLMSALAGSKANKRRESYGVQDGGNLPRQGERMPVLYGKKWVKPDLSQPVLSFYDGGEMVTQKRLTISLGDCAVYAVRIGRRMFWTVEDGLVPPFNGNSKSGSGRNAVQGFDPSGTEAASLARIEFMYGTAGTIMPSDVYTSSQVTGAETPFASESPAWTVWAAACGPGQVVDQIWLTYRWQSIYRTSEGKEYKADSKLTWMARPINDAGVPTGPEFVLLKDHRVSVKVKEEIKETRRIPVPRGRYEVRLQDEAHTDDDWHNKSYWEGLNGIRNDDRVRPGVFEMAMQVRGSKSFQSIPFGEVEVLTARKLPVFDGSSWTAPQETRKAVWSYADVMRNTDYGGAVANDRLDAATLKHYADTLTEYDTFDDVIRGPVSVWQAAATVLFPMRAEPVQLGRGWSMVRDEQQSGRRHLITRSQIVKGTTSITIDLDEESGAHHQIVEYDEDGDPAKPGQVSYVIGLQSLTPVRKRIPGVASYAHAMHLAKWQAAVGAYRREVIPFTTSYAGHVFKRGDRTAIDVWFQDGAIAAKVVQRVNATTLEFDRPVLFASGQRLVLRDRYGLEWGPVVVAGQGSDNRRLVLDATSLAAIEAEHGVTLGNALATIAQDETAARIGSVDELQPNYLIRNIKPANGGKVALEAVFDHPQVWTVLGEPTAPPPSYPPTLNDPATPVITGVRGEVRTFETGIRCTWAINTARGAVAYQVEWSEDDHLWAPVPTGSAGDTAGAFPVAQNFDGDLRIRARGVASDGVPGLWTYSDPIGTVPPVLDGELLAPGTVDFYALIPDTQKYIDDIRKNADSIRERLNGMATAAEQTMADLLAYALRTKETGVVEGLRANQALTTRIDSNGALIAEHRMELLVFRDDTTAALTQLDLVKIDADTAAGISDTRIALQKGTGELVTGALLSSTLAGYLTPFAATALIDDRIELQKASGTLVTSAVLASTLGAYVSDAEAAGLIDGRIELQKTSGAIVTGAQLSSVLSGYVTPSGAEAIADTRIAAQKTSGELVTGAVLNSTLAGYATDAEALAVAQTQATATYNNVTAGGQLVIQAYAAPSGYSSAWFFRLTGPNVRGSLGQAYRSSDGRVITLIEGDAIYAQTAGVSGGAPVPLFQADSGYLKLGGSLAVAGNAIFGGTIQSLATTPGGARRVYMDMTNGALEFWD